MGENKPERSYRMSLSSFMGIMLVSKTVLKDLMELRDRISKDLEKLDSIIETLEIMSDEELMESIKRGLEDIEKGNVVDFEEFLKEVESQ